LEILNHNINEEWMICDGVEAHLLPKAETEVTITCRRISM